MTMSLMFFKEVLRGDVKNSQQYDDKNMPGNIDNLFLKRMQQVTKGHLYHLFGVSDYCVMYRRRGKAVCETSTKVTNWVTDHFR